MALYDEVMTLDDESMDKVVKEGPGYIVKLRPGYVFYDEDGDCEKHCWALVSQYDDDSEYLLAVWTSPWWIHWRNEHGDLERAGIDREELEKISEYLRKAF